ncbi:MAG: hypothetical protein ACREYF_26625, partial [Gammaproteobacteria bacterium]
MMRPPYHKQDFQSAGLSVAILAYFPPTFETLTPGAPLQPHRPGYASRFPKGGPLGHAASSPPHEGSLAVSNDAKDSKIIIEKHPDGYVA